MPPNTGESASVTQLMGETASNLLLFTADDTDLIAELTAGFCKRMNVESRRFRLLKCKLMPVLEKE